MNLRCISSLIVALGVLARCLPVRAARRQVPSPAVATFNAES